MENPIKKKNLVMATVVSLLFAVLVTLGICYFYIKDSENNEQQEDNSYVVTSKQSELGKYIEEHSTGQSDITIAVIDSGISDVDTIASERLLEGNNFTSDEDMTDGYYHGKMLNNLIATETDEHIKILPLKVADSEGNIEIDSVKEAIRYAIDSKADVINLSISMLDSDYDTLKEVIKEASDSGIYTVMSVGNTRQELTESPFSDISNVYRVGAIEDNNTLSKYSDYGNGVDLCSYGTFNSFSGTSYATARVSCTIATMLENGLSDIDSTITQFATKSDAFSKGTVSLTTNETTGEKEENQYDLGYDMYIFDWQDKDEQEIAMYFSSTNPAIVGKYLMDLSDEELEQLKDKATFLNNDIIVQEFELNDEAVCEDSDDVTSNYSSVSESKVNFVDYYIQKYNESNKDLTLSGKAGYGVGKWNDAKFAISDNMYPSQRKSYAEYIVSGLQNNYINNVYDNNISKPGRITVYCATFFNNEGAAFTAPVVNSIGTYITSVQAHYVNWHNETTGVTYEEYNHEFDNQGDTGASYYGISIGFKDVNVADGYYIDSSGVEAYRLGRVESAAGLGAYSYNYLYDNNGVYYTDAGQEVGDYFAFKSQSLRLYKQMNFKELDRYSAHYLYKNNAYGQINQAYRLSDRDSFTTGQSTMVLNVPAMYLSGSAWIDEYTGKTQMENEQAEYVFPVVQANYNIEYVNNGGTGSIAGSVIHKNDNFTLSDGAGMSRDGYSLDSWSVVRHSDNKVYCNDGQWHNFDGTDTYASDSRNWKKFNKGSSENLNSVWTNPNYTGNDTFYFYAQWKPKYSVSLSYDDKVINTVSGGGIYTAGSKVSINATPSNDCKFTNWSFVSADGGTVSNLNSRNYYVEYDTTYGTYIVKSNGVFQPYYSGLAPSVDGGWWYCSNGYVDFNYTGLSENEAENGNGTEWWFVHNGEVDFSYNGIAINSYGIFKCNGGKVDFNAANIATSADTTFYMPSYNVALKAMGKNGGEKTLTLTQDSNIKNVTGGGSYNPGTFVSINATPQTNSSFTQWEFVSAGGGNIINNTSKQYYLIYDNALNKFVVKNKTTHQINTTYTGVVEKFVYSNGVLVPAKSGTGEWWIVQNGAVSYTYTGLVANEDGVGGSSWWFVYNGTVKFDYNGYAINSNGIFKCSNGKVDLNATNIGTTSSMSFYMPSYDVTLKAIGTKNPDPEPTPTPTKYTVTVKGDSHNKVEGTSGSVTSGTIAYATATFNNGYQLDTIEIKTATGTNTKSYWDWTTKGNYLYDKGVMVNVTSDTEITIKSKPIDYNITYNLDNGSLPSGKNNPTTYNIETDTITLVNPERSGYEFTGWTGTGLTSATKTVTISKGSTGNKEYKANWKQLEVKPATVNYTVEYYLQNADGTYAIQSSDTLSNTGKVGDIIKDKRKSYDSTKYLTPTSKSITLSSDTTKNVIQYYYNRTTFNVAVSNGTGTSNATHKSITDNKKKDSYRWGESVQVSTDVNTGYTWDKWTSSDVTGSSDREYTFTMPVKNVTLTASATINSYDVTIQHYVMDTNGNYSTSPNKTSQLESQKYGTTLNNSDYKDTTLIVTNGIEYDTQKTSSTTKITGDTIIKLYYKRIKHTATFNVAFNGGKWQDNNNDNKTEQIYYEADISLDKYIAIKADDFTFIGWSRDKNTQEVLDTAVMGTSDMTFYAIYKKTLTATFTDSQGTKTRTVDIYNNQTSGQVGVPQISSYKDWTDNEVQSSDEQGNSIDTKKNITSDYTTLGYSSIKDINSNNAIDVEIAVNERIITITQDKDYYAVYSSTVTLFYVLNGGTANNTTKTVNDTVYCNAYDLDVIRGKKLNLAQCTKPEYDSNGYIHSYKFVVWTENSITGNRFAQNSEYVLKKNTVMHAVWDEEVRPIEYDILFNGNAGASVSNLPDSIHTKYDEEVIIPNKIPQRTGFNFLGWNTRADGEGTVYQPLDKVKNLTTIDNDSVNLYANWQKKKIVIVKTASTWYNDTIVRRTEGDEEWYNSFGRLTIDEIINYPEERCEQKWHIDNKGNINRIK